MSEEAQPLSNEDALHMATEVVTSYLSNNLVQRDQLTDILKDVHRTLVELSSQSGPKTSAQAPAVPIKRSITPDYIICLEDGNKLKMLKRYLRTRYDLTPDEYRARWGLPYDYPMVAPNYSKRRSEFAKDTGLGKKPTGRGRGRKKAS